MADYHDLLHDIILLILTMLPVKSLLRLRCVSKSWNRLISSQDFAKMHLNQSLINPKPLGLIWKEELRTKEGIKKMHIFAVDCSNQENSAVTIQRLHHPLERESIFVGSCNGLLCVTWASCKGYRFEEFMFVFNPLTRKGSNILCPLTTRSYYHGFGYDDAHDDYKVVRWSVVPKQFPAASEYFSKFDFYSVKNGSWSTRYSRFTLYYTKGISCGVLVNCVLHWIWGSGEGKYKIIAFDLRTDEDKLMETPENDLAITDKFCWRMDLGVLNGCLCGIVFYGHTQNKLDLWIMKEYGLKDSWTKMTIDLPLQHLFAWVVQTKLGRMTPIVPIVHVANKKRMILYSYVQGFLLCDIISNQLSKVIRIPEFYPKEYLRVPEKFSFVLKEFRFEGSLVQLPGFDSFDSLWGEQVVQHEQVVPEPNKRKEKKE